MWLFSNKQWLASWAAKKESEDYRAARAAYSERYRQSHYAPEVRTEIETCLLLKRSRGAKEAVNPFQWVIN